MKAIEVGGIEIEERDSRFGKIIGDDRFEGEVERRIDRRMVEARGGVVRRRRYEWRFESMEEVVREFEDEEGINIKEIDTRRRYGKRLRYKMLILLRERCGLSYPEINKFILFQDLKLYSLSHLYFRAKMLYKKI